MENFENFIYVNELIMLYGSVLTERQRSIMEDYYQYNLSLNEIAENRAITKSAVGDALKVGLKKLSDLEKKIGFHNYLQRTHAIFREIVTYDIDKETIKEIEKLLAEVKNGI